MASQSKDEKGVKNCPAGTVLFREGESGSRMYVIKKGIVRITKKVFDHETTLEELGPGEFCGELALVNDQPRSVTAIVVKDASLIPLDAAQFENMMRGNADIAIRMMKRMCQRLTQAQYRISTMVYRKNSARLLHQLRQEARRHSGGKKVPIPANIAEVLALEIGEVKRLLSEFVKDELITLDREGRFQITDQEAVERYLRYLELHDRFEFRSN